MNCYENETQVTFSFNDRQQVSVGIDADAADFLGGKGTPAHFILAGRTLKVCPGSKSSDAKRTPHVIASSNNFKASTKYKVVQSMRDYIKGLPQGLTWLEGTLRAVGSARWIELKVPSNLSVIDDPDGLPVDQDFILEDLIARIENARMNGIEIEASVKQVVTTTVKKEL